MNNQLLALKQVLEDVSVHQFDDHHKPPCVEISMGFYQSLMQLWQNSADLYNELLDEEDMTYVD